MLNMNYENSTIDLDETYLIEETTSIHDSVNVDLTLKVIDQGDKIKCWIIYKGEIFDKKTIDRLSGHFIQLLKGAVQNPEYRIGLLPLLTIHERHQLLVEWNTGKTNYPRHANIQQLFEEQVIKVSK